MFDVQDFEISKLIVFKTYTFRDELFWVILVYPKLKTIGFGIHVHAQNSEPHDHDDFAGFPKITSKSY